MQPSRTAKDLRRFGIYLTAGSPDLSGVVHLAAIGKSKQDAEYMRKLVLGLLALALFVGAYSVWPVLAAFQIKQAVKSGDVATLERKVHWAPVRASLKASIADLTPVPRLADDNQVQRGVQTLSIWGRIKATAAPMLADKFIDTYVTPEGLTQLHLARKGGWRTLIGMAPKVPANGPTEALSNALQGSEPVAEFGEEPGSLARFVHFYRQLIRAKFHSLSSVEFEIADRNTPARRYISMFELSGYEWKLASVRVVGAGF